MNCALVLTLQRNKCNNITHKPPTWFHVTTFQLSQVKTLILSYKDSYPHQHLLRPPHYLLMRCVLRLRLHILGTASGSKYLLKISRDGKNDTFIQMQAEKHKHTGVYMVLKRCTYFQLHGGVSCLPCQCSTDPHADIKTVSYLTGLTYLLFEPEHLEQSDRR